MTLLFSPLVITHLFLEFVGFPLPLPSIVANVSRFKCDDIVVLSVSRSREVDRESAFESCVVVHRHQSRKSPSSAIP